MKSGKLVLALLTCATSSVFAQASSPQCEATNFDQALGIFTVINPAPGALNQQCFVTIHPAGSAAGRYTEGSYEILLSGGGGGGGGGGSGGRDSKSGDGGQGGAGALPSRTVHHLSPGVYRLTMGTGGQGGAAGWSSAGGNAGHGNPTGVAEAHSGQTIAGFPRAEMWAGHQRYVVATAGGMSGLMDGPSNAVHDGSGPGAINGPNGSSRDGASESGSAGGHGFIKLTQLSQAPQAVTPAPAATIIQQAPAPVRPARRDRN
jgi:hypothetical protein